MEEKGIDRYKQLYLNSKDHKQTRSEIINSIASEYHRIKRGLNDDFCSEYKKENYNDLTNTTHKFILENFSNKQLLKEFLYSPPIRVKDFDRKQFLTDWKKQIKSETSEPTFLEEFCRELAFISTNYTDNLKAIKENKRETLEYKLKYLNELYNCLKFNGLHPDIQKRNERKFSFLIQTKDFNTFIKWNIDKSKLESDYVSKYFNLKNSLLIDGRQIPISNIKSTYIISHPFKEDEISLYSESKGKRYDGTNLSKEIFIYLFENQADEILPHNTIDHSLDEDALKAAIALKELLIIREGTAKERNTKYKTNRKVLENHQEAWSLTSFLVKDFHSFDEFWANKKDVFGLKSFISDQFRPLIKFLEERAKAVIDGQVKSILSVFNTEEITKYWTKSNESIDLDPEEAISRSKSLLESVFKHILDAEKVEYSSQKDDFPKLYKLVASKLELTPKKEYDSIFNQILNGCTSVLEGVSSTRNKMGSSHGKNKEQLEYLPSKRHAELVVSLSGSMAVFLVKSWKKID